MSFHIPRLNRWAWAGLFLLALAGVAGATGSYWVPWGQKQWAIWFVAKQRPAGEIHDEHTGHQHDAHAENSSIQLSANALKNIGYQPLKIEFSEFIKTVTMPGMVVERPGRSQLHVTAPLTGLVTKIYPVEGAALEPGVPLFEMRLTHEELVAAQRDLLRSVENLSVVNSEIQRLSSLGEGVVAGKRILEQEYEKQRLEASIRADREALRLHGLTKEQVDDIVVNRRLFQTQIIHSPEHTHHSDACAEDHLFHVQNLPVKLGQHVEAGQVLCVLADHCELYIEGRAFEDDMAPLRTATQEGWEITASLMAGSREVELVKSLKIKYVADHVDSQSRVFRFYINLPNQVALKQTAPSGHQFLEWRFKPGQRLELRVPVEHWKNRIVLPVDAVVEEGAETYLYQQNGDHFVRVAVHVEYRDQKSVVIANNGAIFQGDIIAARGAYQMHLALKNKAVGGVDPHAGHNH